MTIYIWTNFSKRINSTKRPSNGTSVNCSLKLPTSREQPHFILSMNYANAVYAQWGNDYYFVNDKIYLDNDRVELVCNMDPMATFKNEIGNTTAYIERCGNYSWSNYLVSDPYRPISEAPVVTVSTDSFNNEFLNASDITYVVEVYSTGATYPLILNSNEFQMLCRAVASTNIIWQDAIRDAGVKASDIIKSVIILPVKISSLSAHTVSFMPQINGENFPIDDPFTMQYRGISSRYMFNTCTIEFPMDYSYADQCSIESYVATLYLPFVGTVGVSLDKFYAMGMQALPYFKNMKITRSLDLSNGSILYGVYVAGYDGTEKLVSTFSGNCSSERYIPTQISNTRNKQFATYTAIGGAIAGVGVSLVAQSIPGIAGSLVGGISGLASVANFTPSSIPSSIGGDTGSKIGIDLGLNPVLTLYTYVPEQDRGDTLEVVGLPCYKTEKISDCTAMRGNNGYLKCANASVSISGSESERVTINTYLNGGFYYE